MMRRAVSIVSRVAIVPLLLLAAPRAYAVVTIKGTAQDDHICLDRHFTSNRWCFVGGVAHDIADDYVAVWASDGNDTVVVSSVANCTCSCGTNHADYVYPAGNKSVVVHGEIGNDTMAGGSGLNAYYGEAGTDKMRGGDQEDQPHGGDGSDALYDVGGGVDSLRGDAGLDCLDDPSGWVLCDGGAQEDRCAQAGCIAAGCINMEFDGLPCVAFVCP